jgi:ribosomal protein S18 acetylase RimI-like enzyme
LSEDTIFFSCLDGDDVVAYTCFGPRASTIGTYDLYWICTDTRRRQQGAGRRLMAEVETQVLERDGYLVVLETSDTPAFTPTRKFYEALGYARIVHIERFYSDTDGLVVYAKYLRSVA